MTTPAPGWLSDPTGRHEYRYWDGASWSSDVSDHGVTGIDALSGPLPAPGAAGAPGPQDATGVIDPTQAFPPVSASGPPAPGYGPPTAAYGPPSQGGGGNTGGDGAMPPGPVPPAGPRRSGPSTGLLVGLGVLAIALVVGIGVVLAGGDGDDETSTGDGGATTETTVDDTPATTLPDDDDSGSSDSGGLGDLGDGGDIDLDDEDTREAIVDVVAGQLEGQGIEREQAECLANGILDGISADRLAEIGESGGDLSSLTPEEMSSMMSSILDCGVTGMPGVDPGTGT